MALPLIPGSLPANQIDTAINDTRGYIEDGPTHWDVGVTLPATKISGSVAIVNGGTGSATAAAARTALGIIAANVPTSAGASNVQADMDYLVGQLNNKLNKSGGDITGNLGVGGQIFTPNSVAASSGYVVAYINGDGRISRGASSERFKDDIEDVDPASLGDLFPQLASFVMKDDPGKMTRYGYIAERLDESEALQPFVVYEREPVYEQLDVLDEDGNIIGQQQGAVIGSVRVRDKDGNPIPVSIDFVALLLAQVAQLNQRIAELEARAT